MLAEFEPSLHGRRTSDVTASITSAVRDWAQANGWSSLTEVPVVMPNDPKDVPRRQGLYDIVSERSGLPDHL
jgi:aspartokinase